MHGLTSHARAAVSDGTRKDVKYAKTAAIAAAAKAETRLRRARAMALVGILLRQWQVG